VQDPLPEEKKEELSNFISGQEKKRHISNFKWYLKKLGSE